MAVCWKEAPPLNLFASPRAQCIGNVARSIDCLRAFELHAVWQTQSILLATPPHSCIQTLSPGLIVVSIFTTSDFTLTLPMPRCVMNAWEQTLDKRERHF